MKLIVFVIFFAACNSVSKEKQALSVELNHALRQADINAVNFRLNTVKEMKFYYYQNLDSAAKYKALAETYLELFAYYQKRYDSLTVIYDNLK